jgi:hypothetical protein|tara:strand:+ start:706 stop:1263 length:558 start_codon:yes stop_codon:yes gene_type:complete
MTQILQLVANEYIDPFTYFMFHDILPHGILNRCQEEAQQYTYFLTEKDRTARPDRIWLNRHSGWLSAVAAEFDCTDTKQALSLAMGTPSYRGLQTRVELCMDSAGSWLEPHKDDPAKEMTLQLYLTGLGESTKMGNVTTQSKCNMAWAFDNHAQPVHSLTPLKYNRVSIIINYVNNTWQDKSVLF